MKTKPYLKFLILLIFSVSLASCSKCGKITAVSPDEVHQGEIVSVIIVGVNTSFLVWEFLDVAFIPSNGIDLRGECSVRTNNELECQIEIAEDAELGPRTIVITNGDCLAVKANALEILEP